MGASYAKKTIKGNTASKPAALSGGLMILIGGGAALFLLVACAGGLGIYLICFRSGNFTASGPITKANYSKIKGGMSEADVEAILGKPDWPDMNVEITDMPLVGNEGGRRQIWNNLKDHINVTYCNHKAVCWTCVIGGWYDYQSDRRFAWFNQPKTTPDAQPPPKLDPITKPEPPPKPKPDPNGKLTEAAFDSIRQGKMTRADVEAILGKPAEAGPAEAERPNRTKLRWVEGQIEVIVYVNSTTNVVTGKSCNFK